MRPRNVLAAILALVLWVPLWAGGSSAPTTRSASSPSTQPSDADRKLVQELTRRAIDQIKQRKLEDAEKTLDEALKLSPSHHTTLYNMACVKALRGQGADGMRYLERAVLAGFTDFIHIERDPDLASLRSYTAYRKMLERKEEYLRLSAERTVAWLKRELGEGYLFEIDQQDKLIFATNTDAQTLAALKKRLLIQAQSQWNLLFENRPDQYISVVLPSLEDYKEIIKRPNVGGVYNHDYRILVAQRLGMVMAHEFTHALHNADLDTLGQEHPVWLSEGLGTLFEATQLSGETLSPADGVRLMTLQDAARRGKLIPLVKLLTLDQKAFIADGVASVAYAQSGNFLLYLHEKGLLRKFYDAFKADYGEDKTGRVALEAVTGRKLVEIEKDWKSWMLARKPPKLNTGANDAVIGVKFGEANDGIKVESLAANGPAERAGLKPNDVIIALDGIEARDPSVMLPLLGARQPGERVVVKVRRGEEYMDIPVTLARRAETGQIRRPASRR